MYEFDGKEFDTLDDMLLYVIIDIINSKPSIIIGVSESELTDSILETYDIDTERDDLFLAVKSFKINNSIDGVCYG